MQQKALQLASLDKLHTKCTDRGRGRAQVQQKVRRSDNNCAYNTGIPDARSTTRQSSSQHHSWQHNGSPARASQGVCSTEDIGDLLTSVCEGRGEKAGHMQEAAAQHVEQATAHHPSQALLPPLHQAGLGPAVCITSPYVGLHTQ